VYPYVQTLPGRSKVICSVAQIISCVAKLIAGCGVAHLGVWRSRVCHAMRNSSGDGCNIPVT
jgi:hypothetical protein